MTTNLRSSISLLNSDTSGRRQLEMLILSMKVYKKPLDTVFLIAICRPTVNKWQSKALFLAIFGPRSSIVKSVFDCRPPGLSVGIAETEGR